jgi:hypothetical protein
MILRISTNLPLTSVRDQPFVAETSTKRGEMRLMDSLYCVEKKMYDLIILYFFPTIKNSFPIILSCRIEWSIEQKFILYIENNSNLLCT